MFANYWQVKGAILGIVSIICFGLEVKMWNLRSSEKGQGLVEYALILVLIAVVVIAILTLTGSQLNMIFNRIVLELQYPGKFGGPPAEISLGASASANCFAGSCSAVSASASISFVNGGPGTAYVRFTNKGDGTSVTRSGSGLISSGNIGTGSHGDSVEVCVLGIEGHTLVGAPVCASDTY